MSKVMLYIKTAILSSAVGWLSLMTMLYSGAEALEAIFWVLLIFASTYLGILTIIEEMRRHGHGKKIYKKKSRRKNI